MNVLSLILRQAQDERMETGYFVLNLFMTATSMQNDILHKEEVFHDQWASSTGLDEIAVIEAFEAMTAPENRFIMKLLGDVRGKKILDVGCGLGESSIYLALKGAHVTSVDISPKMVEVCQENAKRFCVNINGIVSSAESLNVEDNHFDVVYAGNILHHVTDKDLFLKNIYQALKTGGIFVAWDPIKYNPLINIYRIMATKVRTEDEKPLGIQDIKISKKYFPDLQHKEFWFLTLLLFVKYFLINRKHPNTVRYWKAILKENERSIGWWFRPLSKIDQFLLKLPFIHWLGWNMVQWGVKDGLEKS